MGCAASNANPADNHVEDIKELQKQLNPNGENQENPEAIDMMGEINKTEKENEEALNGEGEGDNNKDNLGKSAQSSIKTEKRKTKKYTDYSQEDEEMPEEIDGVKLAASTKDYTQDDPDHGVIVDVELLKLLKLSFTEMDMARMLLTATNQYHAKIKNLGGGVKKIRLNKSQVIRAAEIIVERIKSYHAKINDEFDRTKPINDPLLKDILIKVGLRELSESLLNKPCFKDANTKKTDLQKALLYGGKGGNSFKVMAIEII